MAEVEPAAEETIIDVLGEAEAEEGEGMGEEAFNEQFSVPEDKTPAPPPQENTRQAGTTRSGRQYLHTGREQHLHTMREEKVQEGEEKVQEGRP